MKKYLIFILALIFISCGSGSDNSVIASEDSGVSPLIVQDMNTFIEYWNGKHIDDAVINHVHYLCGDYKAERVENTNIVLFTTHYNDTDYEDNTDKLIFKENSLIDGYDKIDDSNEYHRIALNVGLASTLTDAYETESDISLSNIEENIISTYNVSRDYINLWGNGIYFKFSNYLYIILLENNTHFYTYRADYKTANKILKERALDTIDDDFDLIIKDCTEDEIMSELAKYLNN